LLKLAKLSGAVHQLRQGLKSLPSKDGGFNQKKRL